MKVKEVLKLLRADGWQMVRQKGSQRQLQHSQKPGTVTVAGKLSDDLHPQTLASVLRQAQLNVPGQ